MHFRKVAPNLKADESIYVFARPYFLSFLPWFGIGLGMIFLGIVFAIVAYFTFPEIQETAMAHNIFVIMMSAFFLLIIPFITVAFIDYYYDLHIVTDNRLIDIDQHALFVRETNELALEEVQDVTTRHTGLLGNIFDYGLVTIETSSATQKFEFQNIRHPNEIAGIILDLADQAKMRIERGPGEIVAPRGEIKGVVNDTIYKDITELTKMGAIVPLAHNLRVGKDIESNIPSEGADPKQVKKVEIAGIPSAQEVQAKPVHHPPQQVEVVRDEPDQMVEEQEEAAAKEDVVAAQVQAQSSKDNELDIVIDEPENKPKK